MKALIVSNGFPSEEHPNEYAFIQKIYSGFKGEGLEVLVICPKAYGTFKKSIEIIKDICRPSYLSLSKSFKWLPKSVLHFKTRLKYRSFRLAVERALAEKHFLPDVIYCHFLETAIPISKLARNRKIPMIAGIGESSFERYQKNLFPGFIAREISSVAHFICVSRLNKQRLESDYKVSPSKISVIPNGVEEKFFEMYDRLEMRKKYNFPADKFLVGFVGNFVERKGPLRVLAAISGIPETSGVFIGAGAQSPSGNQVAFSGIVNNDEVPQYLSACDVFVLPTLNEGSCNAVIEAMATGLPIISSDIPALSEQVKPEYGLLVNPTDIEALSAAILLLKEEETKRKAMGSSSKREALKFSNALRIRSIVSIMQQVAIK